MKCRDCGFLAVRNPKTGHFQEAIGPTRNNGAVDGYHTLPHCSVAAYDINVECSDRPENFLPVTKEERTCGHFTAWHEGFSPKEHLEMRLLEQQRQWQRDRDKDDREWRDKQAENEHKWEDSVISD